MPEGDTIFRTAATLRLAMEGGRIEDAQIRDRQFEGEHITGATVTAIEARGKHLLMHLEGSRVECRGSRAGEDRSGSRHWTLDSRPSRILHSHMGMTGSWHIYRPGQPWLKPAHHAALWLSINNLEVICFSPKQLELLTADQFRHHGHIQRLGPDLLAKEFDMATAVARFRQHDALPIGEAVMNQTLVCGIGNIYKSEVLFLMRFDPFAPVAEFGDDDLIQMLTKARHLMLRNCDGPNRTTRLGGGTGPLWIYGKSGQPCPECGAVIQLRRQGEAGRTTCWCPVCQPAR